MLGLALCSIFSDIVGLSAPSASDNTKQGGVVDRLEAAIQRNIEGGLGGGPVRAS